MQQNTILTLKIAPEFNFEHWSYGNTHPKRVGTDDTLTFKDDRPPPHKPQPALKKVVSSTSANSNLPVLYTSPKTYSPDKTALMDANTAEISCLIYLSSNGLNKSKKVVLYKTIQLFRWFLHVL